MTKMILMQTELNNNNDLVCKRSEIIKTDKDIDEILSIMGYSKKKIADMRMNRIRTVSKVQQITKGDKKEKPKLKCRLHFGFGFLYIYRVSYLMMSISVSVLLESQRHIIDIVFESNGFETLITILSL